MNKLWLLIQEEPFRLFFPLGILFGLAGTGHWLVYGMGWAGSYSGYYHAAIQTWLYMGAFVGGFLMTAIPRFASAPHASPKEIFAAAGCMILIFILLTKQAWVLAGIAYAAWLLIILSFIVRRFLKKGHGVNPPAEFAWIPIAFLHGISGMGLVVLSQSDVVPALFLRIGRSMAEQGFVLSLVMGIGGFLGQRLMGLYPMPTPEMFKKHQSLYRQRLITNAALGFLLFLSFLREARGAYFLRAAIVTLGLGFVSRVLAPPKAPGLFPRFFSFSFWLVLAGVWLAAFFPTHRVNMLHFLFLGGFSLMTFLVSTMVVLSHSGHPEKVSEPLWIYRVIFAGILSALAVRLTAHLAPEHYFLHLAVASAFWMLTGLAWLVFAAPYLWILPARDESGAGHAC